MKCQFCGFLDTQVKDSRPSDDGLAIKRRRQCPSCGGRFTTLERIENREIRIVKRNGEIRPFDINKVIRSIEVAVRKRNIDADTIDSLASRIMKKLERYSDGEIQSQVVGQLVMEELAQLDEVACVRYASVYMDFSKATDFGKFIADLKSVNDD
jgi:transcriptional repressor NrdR